MFCLLFVICVSILPRTEGQARAERVKEHPDYPGRCYSPDFYGNTSTILRPAESYYPQGDCVEISCTRDGQSLILQSTGCGLLGGKQGCKVDRNLNLQYPDCCPKHRCFEDNLLCSSDEFRCSNDTCIPLTRACDGAVDCPNGADEGIICQSSTTHTTTTESITVQPTTTESITVQPTTTGPRIISIMDFEENQYSNWVLHCDRMTIRLGNIIMDIDKNGKNFIKVSEVFEWSLIKNFKSNFTVDCFNGSSLPSNTYTLSPVHSYEFFVSPSSNESNPIENNTIHDEFSRTVTLREGVKSDVRFDETLKAFKIVLISTNESALHLDIEEVLKHEIYVPLFCLKQSYTYGSGHLITWNYAHGNEYQTSYPDICWTERNKMKRRKCINTGTNNLTFAWSTFSTSDCIQIGRCPPDYKYITVGNSKCLKLVSAANFEDHFFNLKGIEQNLKDIETEELRNLIFKYVVSKGYDEVLIPIEIFPEFDRIISISRYENTGDIFVDGGNFLVDENQFQSHQVSIGDKYFTFDSNMTQKSYNNLTKNVPYVSIIDTYDIIQEHQNIKEFYENNPVIKNNYLCPDDSWYYSHYNAKCLSISSLDRYLSSDKAKSYCIDKSYDLLTLENEYFTFLYGRLLAKENLTSVWVQTHFLTDNLISNQSKERFSLLTPSGRHLVKRGPKLNTIICETNGSTAAASREIEIYLNKSQANKEKLCLNFSNKRISFLKNFPTCYCYPDWKENMKIETESIGCDFEIALSYRALCHCTAVVLHFKGTSVIHSNKFEFSNENYSYFIIEATFENYKISQNTNNRNSQYQNIGTFARLLENNQHAWISRINNTHYNCSFSYLHTDYKSIHNSNNKTCLLHVACSELIRFHHIDNKEIENIWNRNSNITVSVIVKPATGCVYSVISNDHINLTWGSTQGPGYFQPNELCLTGADIPGYRKCEGSHSIGFVWKSFTLQCKENVRDVDKLAYQIWKSNETNKIDNLHTIISKNKNDISAYTVTSVAEIFSEGEQDEDYAAENVVNIVKYILDSSVNNLTEINKLFNASSKILSSFDELLIREKFFLFFNQSEQATDQLVVFAEKISDKYDKKMISINKTDDILSVNILNNTEEKYSFDVIFSIPKSLSVTGKEIGYLYKQWNNHLLFDDRTLNQTHQKLVGDVIDITFIDLKTSKSITDLNDSISITMKQERARTNRRYQCVTWNLEKEVWVMDGCETISESNDEYITCICNHLSYYGILFHIDNKEDEFILDIIVYIGSAVSIPALMFILSSAVLLPNWPNNYEAKSLVNLCISIFGATSALIFGTGLIDYNILCTSMTIILHYFLLSSFSWMSVEAIFFYLIYVKFNFFVDSRLYAIFFTFSWGFPLIVSLVMFAVRYITDESVRYHSCWLLKQDMYYGFLIPLILFISFNLCILLLITYRLWRSVEDNRLRSTLSKKKRQLRALNEVIGLGFLFGLTWLFGLFMLTGNKIITKIFSYIFSILQSLHGFFIFYRVINNKTFRKNWTHFVRNLQGINSRSDEVVGNLQRSNEI